MKMQKLYMALESFHERLRGYGKKKENLERGISQGWVGFDWSRFNGTVHQRQGRHVALCSDGASV